MNEMNENTQGTRVKLHNVLLIIAEEIKRLCEENDIKYFLIAGSLLGAVRHEGFIPWDDDLDMGMLREDYDRFFEVAKSQLKKEFFISDFRIEENYGLSYMKIRLKGTIFSEKNNPEGINNGIFVDIFPIDRMPESRMVRKVQKSAYCILRKSLLHKCRYTNLYENNLQGFFSEFLTGIVSKLSKRSLCKWIIDIQTWGNKGRGDYYISLGSTYTYGKDIYPAHCVEGSLKEAKFEDTKYMIPNSPEDILSLLYGDFMKLPPEDKRVFRHLEGSVFFDDYA